jgi:glycine cleavage system transcriptional repressor
MEKKFIMTVFCKDRPGIVADVSQVIYENGCNLEDSSMTSLSDEFAIILLLSGREEGGLEEQLSKGCRRLEREKGISAFIRPVSSEMELRKEVFFTQTLFVEGLDQAGIVYKISRYLADGNINIANLSSNMSYSPESGTAIYSMKIGIEIPEQISRGSLAHGLNQIADELNVDITFE